MAKRKKSEKVVTPQVSTPPIAAPPMAAPPVKIDGKSGELILSGHRNSILLMEFSPDGAQLMTASYDGSARIWNVRDGRELLCLIAGPDALCGARYSPDGGRVLTFGRDSVARIWDSRNGRLLVSTQEHNDMVRSAIFSPDGARILTGGIGPSDGARQWDAITGEELFRVPASVSGLQSIAYSPDGSRFVTLNVHVSDAQWYWQQQTGKKIERLVDSERSDNHVHVWDAEYGHELFAWKYGDHTKNIVLCSPDGSMIFAEDGESGSICSTTDGSRVSSIYNMNDNYLEPFTCAAFSSDSANILTGTMYNSIQIWNPRNGERKIWVLGDGNPNFPDQPGSASGVAFSPDNSLFLSWGSSPTVSVRNSNDGSVAFTLTGHTQEVYSVAFSPDGNRIATGGRDGSIRIETI